MNSHPTRNFIGIFGFYFIDLYQRSLNLTFVCPFAHTNRHDFRGLVDELVPGVACRIDDVFVTVEDAVRQVGLAQVLPDVFGRVRLRRSGRQEQRRDVVGELQFGGGVPAGAVHEEDGV